MKRKSLYLFLLFALLSLGWGNTGHQIISRNSSLSFNSEMSQFLDWIDSLVYHASDADYRKSSDPEESARHYIDIDNYPEFVQNGRIAFTLDSNISLHGKSFVYEQGILPWATLASFDSLTACFKRKEWNQAMLFASDLGHYVADGFMPLHITRNYNGQYSGNYGIHSRYESSMINKFENKITYNGKEIKLIGRIDEYIFNYLYSSYKYVDSVLTADDYATTLAGNTTSDTYYQALWNKSEAFTHELFSNASKSLAELIYTAWINAGKPMINGSGIFSNSLIDQSFTLLTNPAKELICIQFMIENPSLIQLDLISLDGTKLNLMNNQKYQAGVYRFSKEISSLENGLYFLVLRANQEKHLKKIVILN